jgi:hypothetical protein
MFSDRALHTVRSVASTDRPGPLSLSARRRVNPLVICAIALMFAVFPGTALADPILITPTEGSEFSGRVANTACGTNGVSSIDWGDGTTSAGTADANFNVDGTHTYAEEGTYSGTVSYICPLVSGTQHQAFTASVQDALLNSTGADFSGVAGQPLPPTTVAQLTDANPGADAADFTASIDWGDSTTSTGTITATGTGMFDVSGTHTYAAASPAGGYTVVTSITDVGTSISTAHSTATIAAAPPATPVVHTVGVDQITTSGARVSGSINDNGTATAYRFQYGTDTNYGSTTPDVMSDGSGTDTAVQATLAGLSPDTDYHVRLVADGPLGPVAGEDILFHTATQGTLPGLPPGLDFTWSPKADVLVAGAPAGGVQFQATQGPGVSYQWSFDSAPAGGFVADPGVAGDAPRRAFTADGAHDTNNVQGADGSRRRLYTVRLRATAANGASVVISHDLIVTPNTPPQVDFTVRGPQYVNGPTQFTPFVSEPVGPRVANHIDHIEWQFDSPTAAHPAGDPSATDLICAPDGSACHPPGGGTPGQWFNQGDGHQAVVNFFQRGLAAHGLPVLSTLNMNALPQTAPDGSPLTGGLRVLDGRGPFTVYHDLRVAYLYDNATLLQQSSFALDAGEATGAQLKSGVPLAGDVTSSVRGPRTIKVVPYSTSVSAINPSRLALAALAGRQLDWRHVTLTAVDTAGVRTSVTRSVPLRPVLPPELRAKFVDDSAPSTIRIGRRRAHLAADSQVLDHPLTTKDVLAFDASGTVDPGGRIAYYTLEVGQPQGCREPDPHAQQRYRGLPVFNSINPPVDGYRPGEFFGRPAAAGAGPGLAVGRAGDLITTFANPRNILNVGFGSSGRLRANAAADASSLPTLGAKLAAGPVVHSCSGGAGSYFFHQSDSFAARNVFPSVFMTRQGAAARPPVGRRVRRATESRSRRGSLSYPTTALVTTNPADLRFRIPNPGTYSITVAAYNEAGLGAVQRTDGFRIQSPQGACDNVADQITLSGKTLGFSGECVAVGANRTRFWTSGDLTVNGVSLHATDGGHLFVDTKARLLFATTAGLPSNLDNLSSGDISSMEQRPAGAEVIFERDAVARFSSFGRATADSFITGSADPAVFATATYKGSPVAAAENGGANRNTFHVDFSNGSGDSKAYFMVVLPKEFSSESAGASPTSPVVRVGHTDLPSTELTTNHFAEIAQHRGGGPRAKVASGGVSGSLSLNDTHIGPLFIKEGSLSFDTSQGLWRGDIHEAHLEMWPQYKVSFHIVLQNGALRELGGAVDGAQIPVFAGVFLTGVRFQIVTDPLTLSGGASFSALGGVLTGDLDMVIRTKPVFLRLEGKIAIAGLQLASAYVQYDQASHDTVSFGGHFGYNFGPVSMNADLNGAISGETGEFFIEGKGEVCVGICFGAGALMSNIAVALCGSVHLGPFELSAGAAYRFSPGKLEVFTGCDLEPYKPAIFKASRDRAGGTVGRVRIAVDPLPVAPGTQEVAFRFHGDPASTGSPSVTLISPTGRTYTTSASPGDYVFAPPTADASGIATIGGALIDRDPVNHVTTAIIANPPAGNWQVQTPPGQPPLASVETAPGVHLPDDAFKASVGHAALDATGTRVSTRAYTASITTASAKVLRKLPVIERGRLVSAQINLPAGLTGELALIDAGPASSKPIQTIDLATSPRHLTIAFAPTDEPGIHQIQAIKYQTPAGPGQGALPERSFVVGQYVAPPVPTPTAPKLDVHRDASGQVVVDVTPGDAGTLTGNAATFEIVASTAAGQRVEQIVYGYRGIENKVYRVEINQARPLPDGRFRVVLPGIPTNTTVKVYGRMQYAGAVGQVSSVRLRCRRCRPGQ